MKKLICSLSMFGCILVAGWGAAQEEVTYKVIIHKDNPVSLLARDKVSEMFLKKVDTWENGETVLPVDLVSRSPVREKFSQEIHGKSVRSILNYWQKQIFSGRSSPPPWKMSDGEILDYVKSHPGAIGYVSGQADVKEVKVLKVEL